MLLLVMRESVYLLQVMKPTLKNDLFQSVFHDVKSRGPVIEALKTKAEQLGLESSNTRTKAACDQLLDKYHKALDCAQVCI
jgi:hypothetical protein